VIASLAPIAAGLYGLAALMFTFGRVSANTTMKVIARAGRPEPEVMRTLTAENLLTHPRTRQVASSRSADSR
jgi:hypothetical protein